ncbi:uncharacterized protein LOC106162099 [Lingula anatina]|uniref:Uncharacterized protein LOC106162099 n=1 Tax=Lingula anatina TaxID=7574 RepID=A0A1S3I923_LINAN|nr:uncharacterized protein LOC106162099 [Lingula anatina]|eukprot:XP_013394688.1 uncharacterized protein LOC106162099 [Lingula anatina]
MAGNLRRIGIFAYCKFWSGRFTLSPGVQVLRTKSHLLPKVSSQMQRNFVVYHAHFQKVESPESKETENNRKHWDHSDSIMDDTQTDEQFGQVQQHPEEKLRDQELLQEKQTTRENYYEEWQKKEESFGWKAGAPKQRLHPVSDEIVDKAIKARRKLSKVNKWSLVWLKRYKSIRDVPDEVTRAYWQEAHSLLMARLMFWSAFWIYAGFLFLDYCLRKRYINLVRYTKFIIWLTGGPEDCDLVKDMDENNYVLG